MQKAILSDDEAEARGDPSRRSAHGRAGARDRGARRKHLRPKAAKLRAIFPSCRSAFILKRCAACFPVTCAVISNTPRRRSAWIWWAISIRRFFLRARMRGAIDSLIPLLESYPESARNRLTVYRPDDKRDAIFLHPASRLFERISHSPSSGAGPLDARVRCSSIPLQTQPYLFHVARVRVVRQADQGFPALHRKKFLSKKLVGVRQFTDNRLDEAPVEQLLLLKPGAKVDPASRAVSRAGVDLPHCVRAVRRRNLAWETHRDPAPFGRGTPSPDPRPS